MLSQRHTYRTLWAMAALFVAVVTLTCITACARMGAPDGGWYDEKPPRVIAATPADKGTGVDGRKVNIYFNEYIKLANATEKVVISPPQMEQAEIKTRGKYISIELQDTLIPNTTYTIDFSDAISDNNEGNPMGNYTYSFSTGQTIDTMEVAGTVLSAENLEPVKGILVGLYAVADSAAADTLRAAPGELSMRRDSVASPTMIRVSRSDSRGHFIIRGIAPGRYTVGALQDVDGNYRFSTMAETMAFSQDIIVPSVFEDIRQDTLWADQLHIKDINRVKYNHYMPDNIVLRTFTHKTNDRYYLKADRTEANHFTLFFTAPVINDTAALQRLGMAYDAEARLPHLRGINFGGSSDGDAFRVEPSLKGDTVTYWLTDTALVNQDTLQIEMQTLITDSLGLLNLHTDTLEILAKTSYEKRLKQRAQEVKEWNKQVERMRKRLQDGQELTERDTIMPPKRLEPEYKFSQNLAPDGTLYVNFPTPMRRIDRSAVHLYVMQDSLWYRAPFVFQPVRQEGEILNDTLPRHWEVISEWIPGAEYSFEIDTLAFEDIYGTTSDPYKSGLRVRKLEDYGSLFVNVVYNHTQTGAAQGAPDILVQLLDTSDKPLRTVKAENGTAEFYYLAAGNYYLRAIIDRNRNGQWDTGNYLFNEQPEEVYYYPEKVECKAKWDITKEWNLTARPLDRQKPSEIVKQKAEKEKTVQHRNAQRAQEKGILLPEELR